MEHIERQEERENELRADADELEQAGDRLEERGEEVDRQIGDMRDELETKQSSEEVPGLQEPDDDGGGELPPNAQITPGESDELIEDDKPEVS